MGPPLSGGPITFVRAFSDSIPRSAIVEQVRPATAIVLVILLVIIAIAGIIQLLSM